MSEIPKIVLPHGGYKKLVAFSKSEVIYLGTVAFLRRFLPKHGDRTVDQMTQAARSCKQNIAEGSAASGTSKETEIKLTNVARATLDELMEDYQDYLKSHHLPEWGGNHPRRIKLRAWSKEHNEWSDWVAMFEKQNDETLANAMITIISQTKFLLDRMIASQEKEFKRYGGVRERMHAARTAARAENWSAAIYSRLDAAPTPDELAERERAIIEETRRSAAALRRRKGW